jgi:serine/threonine protein kinase
LDPLIGRELEGRYRMITSLGEGAMGRVYRGERIDTRHPIAIKVMNEDCSEQPDLRERFEREARALFGMQNPHIIDVQDYGVIDGRQPYLVMELLDGQSLESMVESNVLDPAAALDLGRQMLVGLAFAHSQRVLHRDLKTENIFVVRQPDGRLHAKLLDFGLVKFMDDERWGEGRKLTVAGSVMGSPAYMSPEQGTGGSMDARSDVYSAGVVLFELLTGNWPFTGESRMDMLKQHLLAAVPDLSSARPDLRVRPELDALIKRAMGKEATDRYKDASEMLAALDAIPQPAAWLEAPSAPAWTPAGGLPPPSSVRPPAIAPAPVAPVMAQQPAPVIAQPAAPLPATKSGGSSIAFIVVGVLLAFCLVSGAVGLATAFLLR